MIKWKPYKSLFKHKESNAVVGQGKIKVLLSIETGSASYSNVPRPTYSLVFTASVDFWSQSNFGCRSKIIFNFESKIIRGTWTWW